MLRNARLSIELRQLSQTLTPERFQPLSQGLGLGQLEDKKNQPIAPATIAPSMRRPKEGVVPPPKFLCADLNNQMFATPQMPMSQTFSMDSAFASPDRDFKTKRSLLHSFIAHAVDLIVVMMSLMIAMIVTGWVFTPEGEQWSFSVFSNWDPLKIVAGIHPILILFVVYAIFGIYWLFFKFVSGATLGQMLYLRKASRQN